MPIDFPNSPTLNQVFTSGSTSWRWNGTAWNVVRQTTGASGPSGPSGPAGSTGPSGPSGPSGSAGASGAASGIVITVTNSGSGSYTINGATNPTLSFIRGHRYVINVNASGHPFWIQTVSGAYSSGNIYNTGVTNNGASVGTIIVEVPYDAPQLYYVCQNHSVMAGSISVSSFGNTGTGWEILTENQTVSSGTTVTLTGLEVYNRFKVLWYRNETNGGTLAAPADTNDNLLLITVNGGGATNTKFGFSQIDFIGYMQSSNFYNTAGTVGGTDLVGYNAGINAATSNLGPYIIPSHPSGGFIEFNDNLSVSGAKSFSMSLLGRSSINSNSGPRIRHASGIWNNTADKISTIEFSLLYGSSGAWGRTYGGGAFTVSSFFTVYGSRT